jgi:type IV pilus assembly protein PilB
MAGRVRLGELLVDAQIITREQLEETLALQKRMTVAPGGAPGDNPSGRRIGTLLVQAGFVTETQVTQILSQQLSVPWVSLYHIDFSRQLLNLVPHELAEQYCLVPIFVRRVRGLGETLYVAMDDPSDENAQKEVSQFSGLPVRAMIAPPSDIRAAIRVYYGAGKDISSLSEAVAETEAEAAELSRSRGEDGVAPADAGLATGALPLASTPPPPEIREATPEPAVEERISRAPDSAPQIEAREISMPSPKRGGAARMVTLTLLDGTQVNLPAKRAPARPKVPSDPPKGDASELTARDLIAALRAVSHGADASEILGDDVHWEALFAALLSVLLKKHLIADWEFVEEYKKV